MPRRRLPARCWINILMMALTLLSAEVSAHGKTDIITLRNGDRITGEIKALLGGRLSLSTDAMGTLSIEWKDVAGVRSNFNYELRLASGQRLFGSLGPAADPGEYLFSDVFGEQNFRWDEIVELRPIEDSLQDRIDIYISANYAFTKASGVLQTEFRADVDYEDENSLNSFTSRLTVSDTDTESTASSRLNANRKAWTDRKNLYRQLFVGFESNDELRLDSRYTAGAGLGRYFRDTNNSNLVASLSLQALEESSADGDSQSSMEAVVSVGYTQWRFDSPQLDLSIDASLYPSLTEGGRLRADTNARVRWEIIDDLYWDFSTWGSYDNATVDDKAGEFDWGLTTGLGWTF